jgi:hypothetical protein
MYVGHERCLQVKSDGMCMQGHHKYTWVDHQGRKQTVPGFYASGTLQHRSASCLLPSKESSC